MMRFGGFIITYNRPELLIQTINSVFQQTFPPELLWIIDNSDNVDTEFRFKNFEDKRVRYFRMGYNAGPAGGAKKKDWNFVPVMALIGFTGGTIMTLPSH